MTRNALWSGLTLALALGVPAWAQDPSDPQDDPAPGQAAAPGEDGEDTDAESTGDDPIEARSSFVLDVIVAPIQVETVDDEGQPLLIDLDQPGPVDLRIGDKLLIAGGSEGVIGLGASSVTLATPLSQSLEVMVETIEADRQQIRINGLKVMFRDGSYTRFAPDEAGTLTSQVIYGSVNYYGEAGPVGEVSLFSGVEPKPFQLDLDLNRIVNLRVVDGEGTFTGIQGNTVIRDDLGRDMPLREGQRMAAVPSTATVLTLQEVGSRPVRVKRAETGEIETYEQAEKDGQQVKVKLDRRDEVALDLASLADVQVGGSFVTLDELTTFYYTDVQPDVAAVNVLGVDLELDTVSKIRVSFGSVEIQILEGTIRVLGSSTGEDIEVKLLVTPPEGGAPQEITLVVGAGGILEISLTPSLSGGAGTFSFANVGTPGSNVQVAGSPLTAGGAPQGFEQLAGTGGSTVSFVEVPPISPGGPSGETPIPGTFVVNTPGAGFDPASTGLITGATGS